MKKSKQKHIPWGRTLSTNDNFIGKQKTGSKKKRAVAVIDTNNTDLAVVPLSSSQGANRTELKGYGKNKKTYYKHFIEIKDDEGQPIRINRKFRENHKNMDIPYETVKDMRQTLLTKARTKQRNEKVLKKFHDQNKTRKMGVPSDARAYKANSHKPNDNVTKQKPNVKPRITHKRRKGK